MKKGVIGVIMAVVMAIAPPIGFSRTASATNKYRCNSCGQKLFKCGMSIVLAVALITGTIPLNIGRYSSNIKKAKAAGTSSEMGSDNYATQANISVGEKYKFGGYDWIATEASGNLVVLQSKGVTSGYWPGYKIWGNNSYYRSSIDDIDISSYDEKTQKLYNDIKYAEYGSSGLYLISNSKAGQTSYGQQGSEYYWQALKEAAANYSSFGAGYSCAWLGTVDGSDCAWCVYSNGNVYYDNYDQRNSYVVAPAFNLDKSKVILRGNSIVPFSITTGISATKKSIQSIGEGESIDLSSVIGGVTYIGGSADGNNASYTVSCDKGTISGTTYTAPRDVAINDSTVTFTIKSTRNSGWTSSVQVNLAQKYVNVSYDVATNGGTSTAPPSVQDIDIDTVYDSSSSVLTATAEKKPNWTFVGWNTDKDAQEGLSSITMNEDKTLYAIFKKDVTASFVDG